MINIKQIYEAIFALVYNCKVANTLKYSRTMNKKNYP